jgi:hypothetical protein
MSDQLLAVLAKKIAGLVGQLQSPIPTVSCRPEPYLLLKEAWAPIQTNFPQGTMQKHLEAHHFPSPADQFR